MDTNVIGNGMVDSEVEDETYIANLKRKIKEKPFIGQSFINFRPNNVDVFKSKLLKHLENNPITDHENVISLNKECVKVPTQQGEDIIQQCDDSKLGFSVSGSGSIAYSKTGTGIQYAVNNMIIVKSQRAELVLAKRPVFIHHCPRSSMGDDYNDVSFANSSFGNAEDMDCGRNSSKNDDDESLQSSNGSNSDGNESDDDNDDNDYRDIPVDQFIISPSNTQDSIVNTSILDKSERTMLDYIEHAYSCPKILTPEELKKRRENQECHFTACNDPRQIINWCNQKLTDLPLQDDPEHQQFSKVLIYHAYNCQGSAKCKIWLCKQYRAVSIALNSTTFFSNTLDHYKVIYSSIFERNEELREGTDFSLFFTESVGKGAFGEVCDACFESRHTNRAHVAVKKILREPRTEDTFQHSLKCLQQLGSHPHLLLPDVVLSCSAHYLQIMERADISLMGYIKGMFAYFVSAERKPEENTQLITLQTCCFFFHQMTTAILYCHQIGLVHGDIKPTNAVLTGNFRSLKLIDWDFLKEESRAAESGTIGYAAPEVINQTGNVEKASDVYSLCRGLVPLLLGEERPLIDANIQSQLGELISNKHSAIGKIYAEGTMNDPSQRITIDEIVGKFGENPDDGVHSLHQLRMGFQPIIVKRLSTEQITPYSAAFRFVRHWLLKQMSRSIEQSNQDVDEEMDLNFNR